MAPMAMIEGMKPMLCDTIGNASMPAPMLVPATMQVAPTSFEKFFMKGVYFYKKLNKVNPKLMSCLCEFFLQL